MVVSPVGCAFIIDSSVKKIERVLVAEAAVFRVFEAWFGHEVDSGTALGWDGASADTVPD